MYMTDPIGKCMREKGLLLRRFRKNARIHIALRASETYKAAVVGGNEWQHFNSSGARPAVLIWTALPSDCEKKSGADNFKKFDPPVKILIDVKSKMIRKEKDDHSGFVYGFLDDVEGCIFSISSRALCF